MRYSTPVLRLEAIGTALSWIVAVAAMPQRLRGDVPRIGIDEQDTSFVNHGCTPTGYPIRGSIHSFHPMSNEYRLTSMIPDLAEVECPILSRLPVEK